MNLFSKILIGAASVFAFAQASKAGTPTEPAKQPDPPKADPTPTANYNTLLQKGSKGYEVKLLQQKLGITADGIFGSGTEAALYAAVGVKTTTLKAFDILLAQISTKNKALTIKQQIDKQFPITKQVIATVDFSASVAVYRNGNWFSTDLDGKQLPGVTFKKTAQVGAVYSQDYNDPTILIIALPYQVPHNVYNIPANQTYNKIRVKASWIK